MYITERQLFDFFDDNPGAIAHVCERFTRGRRRWTLGVYDFDQDGDLLTLASARRPSEPREFATFDAVVCELRAVACADVRIRWLPGCGGVLDSGV